MDTITVSNVSLTAVQREEYNISDSKFNSKPSIRGAASDQANHRLERLQQFALVASLVLALKVFVAIICEYPDYFPPDFDSVFLAGREVSFHGAYRIAFYAHIVASPIALVMSFYLFVTGLRKWFGPLHRRLGKVLVILILFVVAPSGLVMATESYAGPIAGWGFAIQAILTFVAAGAAALYAKKKQFAIHQQWTTRLFILMCAPLLLRLTSGFLSLGNLETELTYQLSAWLTWLLPLAVFEVRVRMRR